MLLMENKKIAGMDSMLFISPKISYIQTEYSRVFLFLTKEDLGSDIPTSKIKESIKFDGRNYILDKAGSENRVLKLIFSHNNQDPEDFNTWTSYTKDVVKNVQKLFSFSSDPLIEESIKNSFWSSSFNNHDIEKCIVYKLNSLAQEFINSDLEDIEFTKH